MVQLAQARPPFVEFKRVAKHDKQASVAAGYMKYKDIDMAFIMQPGSKDQHEKVAVEWLESIKTKGLSGAADALPPEWIDALHRKYQSWKDGQEAPVNGTSVKLWPLLTPSQIEHFLAINVLSVEDVSAMTEEAMQRFGMGGRELRDKAREWLSGKEVAEKVMQENGELKAQIAALTERMVAMEAAKPVIGGMEATVREAIERNAPAMEEIVALKAQYLEKFGKAPHHKKSADTLRKELEAA